MTLTMNKRTFNVNEYHLMFNAGILTESDRTELITGEIITMSPIGFKHASCVNRLFSLFVRYLGENLTISSQNPIKLNDNSEPQPDLAILKYRDDFYNQQLPQSDDVLLIIEVSDTTLEFDQDVKIPLYASANIPEVWIIDLNSNCLEVYRHIHHGKYQEKLT
ncbi:MAG TPA: Uma2 family endonuclease, partial [Allocoleopsis sp.]